MKAWIIVFLLSINIAYAATIEGVVYDLSLEPANNVIVFIDTEPRQSYVAKNGEYKLNVPEGEYTIKAEEHRQRQVIAYAEEKISVKDQEEYHLDFILFPSLDDEEALLQESSTIGDVEIEDNNSRLRIGLLLAAIVIAAYLLYSRKDKEIDDDLKNLISIIRNEGGRITQKEIRKHMPMSEAKISLMIAELEKKGRIEKIKKGRGNVIILR